MNAQVLVLQVLIGDHIVLLLLLVLVRDVIIDVGRLRFSLRHVVLDVNLVQQVLVLEGWPYLRFLHRCSRLGLLRGLRLLDRMPGSKALGELLVRAVKSSRLVVLEGFLLVHCLSSCERVWGLRVLQGLLSQGPEWIVDLRLSRLAVLDALDSVREVGAALPSSVYVILPLVRLTVCLGVSPSEVRLDPVCWVETLTEVLLGTERRLIKLLLKPSVSSKQVSGLVLNLPRHILHIGLWLLKRLLQLILVLHGSLWLPARSTVAPAPFPLSAQSGLVVLPR